ncbi:amidohydrolase family protein [Phenylobacterium sp.]|uniref:amidohydrolase family protein n=1 Tax=Phenylobacterium sp. TaxID=1871053 RepID=UPI0027327D30|nr:amidohydrolase family protein [Phenylobacterium sp.]MDP3853700.1 amidohydrolase family protein [Phenylobacterium sp.]
MGERGRPAAAGWVAIGLLSVASAAVAAEPVTAIVGATVFDATGAPPRVATVIIREGRVAQVGAKVRVPRGAKVIDAKGKALLPGFFDVHTHWTPGGDPRVTPAIANAYIAAGVTTVNDFHQQPESFAPRRRWLGSLAAPHVNFVARMSTPGGHGADWADEATTKWLSSPQDARTEVKALVPYKPDFIKAFTDGWRYGVSADNTSMDQGTLSALVDEAHKNDIRVLTHTVTIERGAIAARAKVDIIAHSLQDRLIDAETVALIKAAGAAYAPTLAVYDPDKSGREQPDTPARRHSITKFGYALGNVKALSDAGVNVVLGTDAGMPGTPHGVSTLREMELLVKAGLTPTQALMAGTSNSARALGEIADRGTIEAGKRADLVLISGAPWNDIADVRKIERVFVDGAPVHGARFKAPAANSATAMPAIKVAALIDDFERADGRSSLDTLRLNDMDGGIDRTLQVAQVIDRAGAGHALSLAARMAAKDDPSAGVIIPLSRGSVEPVDARAFRGVRFEVRGAGTYDFDINTTNSKWRAEVTAGGDWRAVEVPFGALRRAAGRGQATGPWTGDDLLEVEFAGSRGPGEKLWLEVDNVTFY